MNQSPLRRKRMGASATGTEQNPQSKAERKESITKQIMAAIRAAVVIIATRILLDIHRSSQSETAF